MADCNRCTYERMKERYEKEGLKLTVVDGESLMSIKCSPKDVYVHPPHIDINSLSHNQREQYWLIWFMGLPDHCDC